MSTDERGCSLVRISRYPSDRVYRAIEHHHAYIHGHIHNDKGFPTVPLCMITARQRNSRRWRPSPAPAQAGGAPQAAEPVRQPSGHKSRARMSSRSCHARQARPPRSRYLISIPARRNSLTYPAMHAPESPAKRIQRNDLRADVHADPLPMQELRVFVRQVKPSRFRPIKPKFMRVFSGRDMRMSTRRHIRIDANRHIWNFSATPSMHPILRAELPIPLRIQH